MAKKTKAKISSADATKTLAAARKALESRLVKAKLGKYKVALASLARPSIRVVTKRVNKKEAAKLAATVGASRFGGVPDLPPKTKWPTRGGLSLAFIAQLRCDELSAYDESGRLPTTGLLSFFVMGTPESDEYGDYAVVFHFKDPADASSLTPIAPPDGEEREYDPQQVAAVSFRAELSLPNPEGHAIDALTKKMSEEEQQAYWDKVWLDFAGQSGPYHRIFGYPDMSTNFAQKKNELLFQIDSDDASGWEFGDAQATRLYIAPAALKEANFKKVRASSAEE